MERTWRESMGAWLMSTGALSPYNTNPLGINPLREAITASRDPMRPMRILIATDAWEPQVNGVVRTLTTVVAELRAMGAAEIAGFRTDPGAHGISSADRVADGHLDELDAELGDGARRCRRRRPER